MLTPAASLAAGHFYVDANGAQDSTGLTEALAHSLGHTAELLFCLFMIIGLNG